MAFGKKLGSAKAVKESLKSGNSPMRYIGKDTALTVRFLEEPESWVSFTEVYDPVKKRGYPLPDDPFMPGYDDDLRKSSRYLANAIDISTDKVIAVSLPKSVVNSLIGRYEKLGTMTDRNYELYRTGSGLDTEYFADPDAPAKMNLAKYEPKDLESVLEEAYNAVWGSGTDEDEEELKPARKVASGGPKRGRKTVEAEEDDDLDDEDDDIEEDEIDDDEDDVEEDDELDDDDDDDEPWYEEDELLALTVGERRAIARELGVKLVKGMTKAQQVQAIIDAQEESI